MDTSFLCHALASREALGRRRELRSRQPLIDLTSNDTLGLANCPQLQMQALQRYLEISETPGIAPLNGATGSRLLTGNHDYVEALESQIASFHQAETGLIYSTGYAANLGLWSSIASEQDSILLDRDIHASTWDGARLSQARCLPFRHNDVDSLESLLKKTNGRCFVAVEALYSMSGDSPPLRDIVDCCERYGAYLVVDEAHSNGVLGPQGRGLVCALGLEKRIFARIHTFGKALGAQGAIVLGSRIVRDYLLNFSRSFVYSTALPLYSLVLIASAYEHIAKADGERKHLENLIQHFKLLYSGASDSFIQCIPVTPENAHPYSAKLAEAGLDVRPILHPTVRRGQECLRVCLHSFNTIEHLHRLVHCLNGCEIEAVNARGTVTCDR